MKYTITAAAVSVCIFFCGCGSKMDSVPEQDSTTAVTTTVSTDVSETQKPEKAAATEMPKEAKETSAKKTTATTTNSGMREESAPAGQTNTVPGDQPASSNAPAQSERAGTITTAAKTQSRQNSNAVQTETPATGQTEQTEAATPDARTDEQEDNGNVLPDDGLEWSPLVPVN